MLTIGSYGPFTINDSKVLDSVGAIVGLSVNRVRQQEKKGVLLLDYEIKSSRRWCHEEKETGGASLIDFAAETVDCMLARSAEKVSEDYRQKMIDDIIPVFNRFRNVVYAEGATNTKNAVQLPWLIKPYVDNKKKDT
eukprot:UN21556